MNNPDVTDNPQTPEGVCSMPLLGALVQATKDFDMDVWKEQDSSCLLCHTTMGLDFGCEWPDDPRMLLCWSCMSNVLAEMFASMEAPNTKIRHDADSAVPQRKEHSNEL